MKSFFSSIVILILSSLSKASDIGMDMNYLKNHTNINGAVATDGTGTCRVTKQNENFSSVKLQDLSINDIRLKLKNASSYSEKQNILNEVERALFDEDSSSL